MARIRNVTGLILAVFFAGTGCVHLDKASLPRAVQPLPADVLQALVYEKPDLAPRTVSLLESNASYAVQRIEMTAAANHVWTNRTLILDYYRPLGTNRPPVVMVLPIIGGGYPIERHFCSYFARHGLAAVLVRRDRLKTPDNLGEIDGMLRQAAVDSRQALDWVETRPELDAGRIAAFGVSMGGIRAAFLTPLDSRIRASIIGLAGGDLPYILTYSCEPGLTRRRGNYLKKHNLTLEEFRDGLKPIMVCDPLKVAPAIDPDKVLLVLGICDTAVPSKKGFELRKAMGKPETVVVPTGHYTALLYLPYIKSACLHFLRDKLQ
jgi:hypothetical protein